MANTTTAWNINTDIYGITDSLNELKKRYIEDEDETTLSLGIFGYVTDTEAKKIQSSVIMTGELGNEMFPTKAKLSKNVLAHAIYCNIEDINAIPSTMTLNIGIKVRDFEKYMQGNRFTFDHSYPIFIGEYEFHFDYDIIIIRSETINNTYVYSAHYDMSDENRLSDITDPYLKQPFTLKIGNDDFIVFQSLIRQITIEETTDRISKESIIDNKTYTFEFENQIADFDVYVTDNDKTTRLKPIPYGSSVENEQNYCWYLFITDNTIRISFDNKSYIPGLNSEIYIKAYTTLGANSNFNYKKIDEFYDGFYVELQSEKYNYDRIVCYAVPTTDATGGRDRKTTESLQNLIPKAALSRGSITTETDVSNYFNLIDDDTNRLKMQKKVDNQIERLWYSYFLLKDEDNNIIPTNSIDMKINVSDFSTVSVLGDNKRHILPAGTIIRYDAESKIGEIIDESEVPALFSDEYFSSQYYYYMTIYNTILNEDPLYAAFYLTISNKDSFFCFNYVNEEVDMQFIATRCNFQRNLLVDQQIYKFTFSIAQSISADVGLYAIDTVEETDKEGKIIKNTVITNNMKCILVLYDEDTPYRWVEANLVDYDSNRFKSDWNLELTTDNVMDDRNRLKINNLHVSGSTATNYGFFDANTKAKLYILAKFSDGEYGRGDLDSIAPGFDGWSLTNVYSVNNGLDFFENFTTVLASRVEVDDNTDNIYSVSKVPVVGLHYMDDMERSDYLIKAIDEKKAYIDYCLKLLENSIGIDFKFFNTYGPSVIYTIGDKKETPIGHVDITLKFRASLKPTADVYTKDELIKEIKSYIENLYGNDDWHAPNMINDIYSKFADRLNYLEFMNYNDFWLGVQHIIMNTPDDPTVVPEFINVRNRYNITGNIEPCIDIEISY